MATRPGPTARLVICMAVGLMSLSTSGCQRRGGQGDFIARVGTSVLTSDEIPGGMENGPDSSARTFQYINQWVSSELLYQEALRRELDKSEKVSDQLAAVRKRLIIEALLDDVLYPDSTEITEDAIASYFSSHEAEFSLSEDVALVSYAGFVDRGAANTFRSGIVRGSTWDQATEQLLADTILVPHLKQLTTREYATRPTLFPEELWKIARNLNPPGVSFVVNTESGYYVLYLHDFRRQGATADMPYVAAEIFGRLLIQSRRERHEELMRTLRSRFPVEVRFLPGRADTNGGEGSF